MKRATWILILAGVLAGGFGLHLIVTSPLERQITKLNGEVVELHRGLSALADFRDDVVQANTLLSELEKQSNRLHQVRADLENVRMLEQEVLRQSKSAQAATVALADVADVQSEVIAQNSRIEAMTKTLDQMAEYQRYAQQSMQRLEEFHQRIVTESDGMDVAETQFTRLVGLKKSVEAIESSEIDLAKSRLDDLDRLRQGLVDGGRQTSAAKQVSEQLIALQEELVAQGTDADLARKHAAQLLNLEQTLSHDARTHIDGAMENLAALLEMEERLASQNTQLAQAIESLELMQDLQDEFHRRAQDLEGIRRGLTELVMLESLVARTVRSLRPLADLTNLRRLDAGQIRSIAQSLLEQQSQRVADAEANATQEELVPLPIELQ